MQSDHNYNTLHIMDGSSRIATVRVGNHTADTTPAQKFFVEDHLGNASVVVNTSGARINLEEYYPFGETAFGSYQYKRYRYNGKEKDEHTGLYEYGQRYYAPWLCRFVSVDPIAEDYPQLSSYNYAGNKPISARDIEGLQSSLDDIQVPQKMESKGAGSFSTYGTPSGDTFMATGIHNVATARGKDEVMTTSGTLVSTRTNALLQFDFQGENYRAHFSAKTLDFTDYKTDDGKRFPLEFTRGEYTADITISISETSEGMMTLHAVISGNEDWHFNESEFTFTFPIDFDTNYGADLSNDLPEANIDTELFQMNMTGKIHFDDLDTDLRELVDGLRFEFSEFLIEADKLLKEPEGKITAQGGVSAFKAMDQNYNTVISATKVSFKFGLLDTGKLSSVMGALENINPSPLNLKLARGNTTNVTFSNIPTRKDSVSKGLVEF